MRLLLPLLVACAGPDESLGPAVADSGPVDSAEPLSDVDPSAYDYLLVVPIHEASTLLVDGAGREVHRWEHADVPGLTAYLLDDGTLLRTSQVDSATFRGGGIGGRVERLDWDGAVLWSYEVADDRAHQHHDVAVLPSGNVLMIAWDRVTFDEAVALGRDPALTHADGLWAEQLIEVDPTTDEIVWRWRVLDHVVQDRDPEAPSYVPSVADTPGAVDIDAVATAKDADWLHANAVDHDPVRDLVVLSSRHLSEIWVIDHAPNTEEAAGPAGELLFRWGNPELWGGPGERALYGQHDVRWIDEGLPGAGELLLFDNGDPVLRPWSRVVQLPLPSSIGGSSGAPSGAEPGAAAAGWAVEPSWVWQAEVPTELFAPFVSGVERQPDGSTLVCDGPDGRIFAVDEDGDVPWSLTYGRDLFRPTRYPADHPALAGRSLLPGEAVAEVETAR